MGLVKTREIGQGAEDDTRGVIVCVVWGEAGEGWVDRGEPVALGFNGGVGWAWGGPWDEDKTGVLPGLQQGSGHALERPRSKSPELFKMLPGGFLMGRWPWQTGNSLHSFFGRGRGQCHFGRFRAGCFPGHRFRTTRHGCGE